jgi:diguanylate cyclase (GGDEF)-like protein
VASAAFSRAVATTYLIGTLAAVSVVMHFSQLQPPPLLWIVQLGAIAGTGIAVGYFIRWLKWYATTDDLTGVATRRAFDQVLDSYLKAARPGESPVSLAMIDLDDFKVVNDTEGHPAGDQLLRDVVDAWRRRLRTDDLIARLGGDEFALVLLNTDETSAGALVAELAVHTARARGPWAWWRLVRATPWGRWSTAPMPSSSGTNGDTRSPGPAVLPA